MLKKIRKIYNDNAPIILSFFLASVITLIVYASMGIYPFGDKNLLRIDLYHQYAPFHEELRYKILNGGSFFYSWSSGLGKNFLSQIAYYTSSPLNILLVFFKQNQIAEFIAVSILLKISFISAFFAYYLKRIYKKNDLSIVMFSLGYATSAFVMAYYWNLMWLDAVALFPLVVCGMELILRENKYSLYLFSLAILIISNFYIGFICCIFTALYFLVLLLCRYSIRRDFKKIVKKSLMFGLASILAAGLAAFILIPTFLTLKTTAASGKGLPYGWDYFFDILAYYPAHFMGVMPKVLVKNESVPNIYPGLLTMILLPFYLASKNIKLKEKILYILLLFLMFLGFYLNKLNFILHGYHFPANLPHRYSFIYIFILIVLAYKTFRFKDEIYLSTFIGMNVFSLIYIFVYGFSVTLIAEFEKYERAALFLNLAFIILYTVIFFLYKKTKIKKQIILALCVLIVFLESGTSLGIGMHFTGTQDREAYIEKIDGYNALSEKVDDKGFYRSEFSKYTTLNDGSLHHYNGLSTFSSTANGDTSNMFEHLGLPSTGNSYRYADATSIIDSFFAIKYLYSTYKMDKIGYEYIAEEDNIFQYKNVNPLELGFLVDEAIEDWDFSSRNPFQVQNDLIKKSTGLDLDVFEEGIIVEDYTTNNVTISGVVSSENGTAEVNAPKDIDSVPNINMNLYTQNAGHMMFYIYAPNTTSITVKIGDETKQVDLSTGKGLIDLDYQSAGEIINLDFNLDRKGLDEEYYRTSCGLGIYPVFYNHDNFLEAYDVLEKGNMDIYEFSDNQVKAAINAEEDKVLFTSIPYDNGWEILIDGEIAEPVSVANNALLAIKVPEGQHDIDFKFVPDGFYLGLKITLGSLALLIAITLIEIALRKKEYYFKIEDNAYDDFEIRKFINFDHFIEENFGDNFDNEMDFEVYISTNEDKNEEKPEQILDDFTDDEIGIYSPDEFYHSDEKDDDDLD